MPGWTVLLSLILSMKYIIAFNYTTTVCFSLGVTHVVLSVADELCKLFGPGHVAPLSNVDKVGDDIVSSDRHPIEAGETKRKRGPRRRRPLPWPHALHRIGHGSDVVCTIWQYISRVRVDYLSMAYTLFKAIHVLVEK
jgi:hypothetical protein